MARLGSWLCRRCGCSRSRLRSCRRWSIWRWSVQLLRTLTDYLQHGEQFNSENLFITASYYAAFMAVDLTAAGIAFFLEKKEDRSLLWWLVLQRFGYRQIMYYVVVKSVLKAVQGRLVGWGKLERKATVTTAAMVDEEGAAVPLHATGL